MTTDTSAGLTRQYAIVEELHEHGPWCGNRCKPLYDASEADALLADLRGKLAEANKRADTYVAIALDRATDLCKAEQQLEAERAKVREMQERCAVTAWRIGMDMYETRFDHDPREVGSAIAGAIRTLPASVDAKGDAK
jgi:hypothetical protein